MGVLRPGRLQSSGTRAASAQTPACPSIRASNPNLRANPGGLFWVKISGAHCQDKYQSNIRGLIPPDESKERDFPPLLFLRAFTLHAQSAAGHYCGSVTKSCLTLCNSMDCSPPGSSVYEIFSARILEWISIFFSSIYFRKHVVTSTSSSL